MPAKLFSILSGGAKTFQEDARLQMTQFRRYGARNG